jgi:hypothetical protein
MISPTIIRQSSAMSVSTFHLLHSMVVVLGWLLQGSYEMTAQKFLLFNYQKNCTTYGKYVLDIKCVSFLSMTSAQTIFCQIFSKLRTSYAKMYK